MIRNIIFFTLTVCVLFMPVYPISAEKISVERELLEKILKRQDALEKEIEQLKKQIEEKDKLITPAVEDVILLKEDVEEISETLDTVETRTILDKIQLSGEFRTELHSYKYEGMDEPKKDGRIDEIWSGRLRINLRSEITKNIIFQGRLSYFKFWGDTNYDGSDYTESRTVNDLTYQREPDKEGDLHVERAYFDYFAGDTPLSVTVGRMPTGNGPPYGLRNNTTRKATWPMLCHDGEVDGIMTNLSLDKWTGLQTSFLRFGYYKISQNYQQYKGVDNDPYRVGIVAFETEIPGINNSILWLSFDRSFDLAPFEPEGVPIISKPPDSGSFDKYNAHIQFNNIKNTGFSFFGSFVYQDIKPRAQGTVISWEILQQGNPAWPSYYDYQGGFLGDNVPDSSGEISLGKSQKAYGYYAGLNYRLPFEKLKYPKLGFEYNHGSKYYIYGPSSGGDDFFNKLTVNGDVYEVYYIQPIDERYMFCRFGVIYAKHKHIMWYYTPPGDIDTTVTDVYFLVNIRF
ncbi:MAG: DUF3373 family protein [Desulfobacterales bacterium]|nr:DUF3373 family protein [Desulfobacterales bacterium]